MDDCQAISYPSVSFIGWGKVGLFFNCGRLKTRVSADAGGIRTLLVIGDKSAWYWFVINEQVCVVENVYFNHQKTNLKHQVGTVIQTLEK